MARQDWFCLTQELIEEGYLLDEDLNEIVGGARRSWNDLVESTQ